MKATTAVSCNEIDQGNEASVAALAEALDRVSIPTFLLRRDGYITHANTAGYALLRGNHTLYRSHSRLATRRIREAKVLVAALARVADCQRRELLRLSDRSGNASLFMSITPVPKEALVTMCVADLHADRPSLGWWIEEAFGLSSKNAELADSLMSGLSLAEFCGAKGVTPGAARTRLKKLFTQTGKKSQAALVSTLLRAAMIAPLA